MLYMNLLVYILDLVVTMVVMTFIKTLYITEHGKIISIKIRFSSMKPLRHSILILLRLGLHIYTCSIMLYCINTDLLNDLVGILVTGKKLICP